MKNDLSAWQLHGPVRSLRTQFAEWNPDLPGASVSSDDDDVEQPG
jgi:hypothetical protein